MVRRADWPYEQIIRELRAQYFVHRSGLLHDPTHPRTFEAQDGGRVPSDRSANPESRRNARLRRKYKISFGVELADSARWDRSLIGRGVRNARGQRPIPLGWLSSGISSAGW
jgi:hypothetical protein